MADDEARFRMHRYDQSTWKPALDHEWAGSWARAAGFPGQRLGGCRLTAGYWRRGPVRGLMMVMSEPNELDCPAHLR
jgi:hypothetical protein